MHKNLAILTGIFVLPVLSVCCSLAQDNADVKAFEELQRQLWSARTPTKAQKLMAVTAELDSICSRLLQGQNDFSAKKARIDSFYSYDGRIPLLRIAGIDQETSVVIYNISYGGDAFIPIVNVFSTIKGEARKIATLSFEKAKFSPDTYMQMYVPFQHVCILDDALENKKHIILGGGSRIGNYLALIEMNRNKGELILLETRYFNMWNAHVENCIRLESDGIIVRYPRESYVITEGWGGSMLLVEDHFSVRNGALKTVARKVLNPWYETVLDAIRLQATGDRDGFDKLCKAQGAWQLLSGKTNMSVEQQEKIDDIKAIVILAIMSSQTKFVFYVSREDEKWVITEIGTI